MKTRSYLLQSKLFKLSLHVALVMLLKMSDSFFFILFPFQFSSESLQANGSYDVQCIFIIITKPEQKNYSRYENVLYELLYNLSK